MASPVYSADGKTIVGYSNTPAAPGVVQSVNQKSTTPTTTTGASYTPSGTPPVTPPATTPATTPTTTTPTTTPSPSGATPGGTGSDSEFSTAMASEAPTTVPSEDSFYADVYNQISPVISAINDAESSAETAAYAAGTNAQTSLSASLGARGLAGSGEAITEGENTDLATAQNIANAKQAKATALASVTQFAIPQAYTAYTDALTRNDANSQAYVKQQQANMASALAGLASSGVTIADLEKSNPQEYNQLLQYAGGDANVLAETYLQAATKNNTLLNGGQPLTTNGNTLVYGVQTIGPDGKPTMSTQTLTLPFNIPSTYGWTMTKTGTNTSVLTDPNNGANYIAYTTDPLTGQVTVTGSGTGLTALQGSGITPGVAGNGNTTPSTGAASTTASANYIDTVGSVAGITDPTTPFSGTDIGGIVSGIVAAEGGSPQGVQNNPGNVKYVAGMAGATDSGVKAPDGGTFASFATAQDGLNAIASTLQSIASNLGTGASVQQVLSKYANLSGGGTAATTGSTGLSTTEYGALANVSGFDPGKPGGTQTSSQIIDQGAFNYLQTFLSTGTPPASTGGMGGLPAKVYQSAIQARAEELYTAATGKPLPNAEELSNNLTLITQNQGLQNSLKVQEGTISANSALLQNKITAANINQNAPAINAILDPIANAMGNPAMAAYLAQNSTLSNELGSLLALKNASGTTVHDKLISAGLLSPNASAAQEADVVNTLMQEAQNAHGAIATASLGLYTQTDPLGIDPANPMNSTMTLVDPSTGAGTTFTPGSLTPAEVQQFISAGYTLQ